MLNLLSQHDLHSLKSRQDNPILESGLSVASPVLGVNPISRHGKCHKHHEDAHVNLLEFG